MDNSDGDSYKYYGNYDKNIKAIKGSGVITPSNPPNRTNRVETIKNTWNNGIQPTIPLSQTVYYSDKNLTSGYLNTNDFVEDGTNQPISNYYYPSQKFNNVIIKPNKKKVNFLLENTNGLKFPPPLINSYLNDKIKPKYSKPKYSKPKYSEPKYSEPKYSEPNINTSSYTESSSDDDLSYINSVYDGKFIYNIEKNKLNIPSGFPIYEFAYTNSPKSIITKQEIQDNFSNSNEQKNSNYNIVLLIILSILIIFYFTIHRK